MSKRKVALKNRLDLFLELSSKDALSGLLYPSRCFIDSILIPGDTTTNDLISKLVESARISSKHRKISNNQESSYFLEKTSNEKLERYPHVKAFIFVLIKETWKIVCEASLLDESSSTRNIQFLNRMKKQLLVADKEIDTLIFLNRSD